MNQYAPQAPPMAVNPAYYGMGSPAGPPGIMGPGPGPQGGGYPPHAAPRMPPGANNNNGGRGGGGGGGMPPGPQPPFPDHMGGGKIMGSYDDDDGLEDDIYHVDGEYYEDDGTQGQVRGGCMGGTQGHVGGGKGGASTAWTRSTTRMMAHRDR
jgi:hypothetical protein